MICRVETIRLGNEIAARDFGERRFRVRITAKADIGQAEVVVWNINVDPVAVEGDATSLLRPQALGGQEIIDSGLPLLILNVGETLVVECVPGDVSLSLLDGGLGVRLLMSQ